MSEVAEFIVKWLLIVGCSLFYVLIGMNHLVETIEILGHFFGTSTDENELPSPNNENAND